MSVCKYCYKSVKADLYGIKLDCNHWVHSLCLDKKNPDFGQCPECKGIVIESHCPEEPSSINGKDYIEEPVSRIGILKRGIISTKEPYNWLKEKKDIKWIIREKQFGLQKMLEAGVTIDDLFGYGYQWDDIKQFKDFSVATKERGRKALQALGCTAEHFRDHYEYFGKQVIDHMQINGRHFVEQFGLQFAGNQLVVAGGQNKKEWHGQDLVKLGFKLKDLYGAGLETLDQYITLKTTDEDEEYLGVTKKDLDSLPYSLDKPKVPLEEKAVHEPKEVFEPRPSSLSEPRPSLSEPRPLASARIKKKRVHGIRPK